MKLYSIFDTIKNQFSPPLMCVTDGQAWREWDQFIKQDRYAVDHTDEFLLYYIADYDIETGNVEPIIPTRLHKHLDTEDLILDKDFEDPTKFQGEPIK